MKHKKIILPAIIAAAIAGTILATGASASWGNNDMSSSLAQKLGVDQSKVTDAMEQIQTENRAAKIAETNTKLDKAVTDGVITVKQKTALLAKQEEIRAKQEALRTEMEQWYTDNGIDATKLEDYGMGGGMGMGRHGGRGHGQE